LDSCLHGSIDTRADTYSLFLSLAEVCHLSVVVEPSWLSDAFIQHCKKAGNLASVSDLLYGLRSPLITCLKRTLQLARNVDERLKALVQSLHPRNPHRFLSLSESTSLFLPHHWSISPNRTSGTNFNICIDARMKDLVALFGETSPEPGKISWTRCRLLYSELEKVVIVPRETPLPLVDLTYYSFVSFRMHSAWQNRANHPNLSQRIAEDEPHQMGRWMDRAAGFNH
jgi:hypothetical protein